MASHRRSRRLSSVGTDRRGPLSQRRIRPRRLWFETLEDRRVLDAAVPTLVDLLPDSDSGLFDDDNLTNIRTATIEITAAAVGEGIRVYRDAELVSEAAHYDGLLYRYTFAVGQLVEGPNTITARGFDGVAESADSPPLVITLDTLGPRIVAATPSAPVDLRAAALDSITVTFNEPIDAGSFTVADVAIQGPAGAIPPTDITADGDEEFQIHFAPQTQRGTYRVTVGPEVVDLAGNLMDQNNNGTPGEAADAYQYVIAAYDADVIFTTATTIAEGNTTYENQHLLINGTTVTINGPHNFGSVHLINGAVLTHSPNTTTQTYKLDLTVTEQVIVDSTSRIDVSGKGYLEGRTTGNTTSGGATWRSGGSYGGSGGVGGGGTTNSVYGDYADPEDWGSGGGTYSGGGSGGGLARIRASSFTLDGQILANGAFHDYGAGSGGGIYVAVDSLSGTGSITASGGSGQSSGGGGGGRIAVYAEDLTGFDVAKITAAGGIDSSNGNDGGAGTVHIIQGPAPTRVRWHAPLGRFGGVVTDVNDVRLHFNKLIDLDAFTSADLSARGPLGPIEVSGLTLVGDRLYRIDIPAQSREGYYHFTVHPTLMGVEGFPIDQNANGIPGEPEDFYSFTLILDTTPPRITRHEPAGDVAGTLASVDVWFSEAIDKSTFTTADVAITRPDGTALAASSVQEVGFNRFRIGFAPQTATGVYSIQVGPNITDLAGNLMDQDRDGIFGEPDDDVYVATVNLVPVDLGLNNLVVHADTLWAGEPVTVSWSGMNRTGAPLLGNWTDGVYLSSDDQWDIRDVLLETVPHSGGLTENETYSQSVDVVIPGKLPEDYHILVRGDVEFQQRELDKTDNLIASDPIPLDVRPLPADGTPVQGTLTRTDRADYYVVQVAPGDSLRLTLDGHAATGSNELYVAYEAIPTRQQSDHRATAAGQDQQIVLTGEPNGGTYYVMVYGSEIDTETEHDLMGETAPVLVTEITPNRHGNAEPATVTISGAGFDPSTIVEFLAGDAVVYSPQRTELLSSSILRVTLDLPAWPADVYDVRVTKLTNDGSPASYDLASAFPVTQGGTPRLETNLIVPNAVGFAIPIRQTIWVEYKNTGDLPMPAPFLELHGDQGARITADVNLAKPVRGFGTVPGVTDTVKLVALGSSSTPGLLLPGESGRIPVYYIGLSQSANYPRVTFNLNVLNGDALIPIDWIGLKSDLRPEWMDGDTWEAVWENLRTGIGPRWGDYVRAFGDNVNHLSGMGKATSGFEEIWGFEFAQATAQLSPVGTLSSAVDATVPTPGLTLQFTRVYRQPIPSRYELGPLGRGWSHNWEVYVRSLSTGDIVLKGPNGSDRYFTRKTDGAQVYYEPAKGDHASLTVSNEAFRLTEPDQTVWQFRTDGQLDYVQDRNGNRISLAYTNGTLTTLSHSNGRQLHLEYDATGRLTRLTEPGGAGSSGDRVTTYEYDASGQYLQSVAAPGDRVTTYSYETDGTIQQRHALLEVVYPDGRQDHFRYDQRGRLVETSQSGCVACGESVFYTYDSSGGVTATDATGRRTYFGFGPGGEVARVRDGNGQIVQLGYDDANQLTRIVGPSGERYLLGYDSRGNLTSILDPLRHQTVLTYETSFGQLDTVTDARGNTIDYQYAPTTGNLTSIVYEDATDEEFTYDAAGNVLAWTNRRGQTVTYTYNADGQLTSKDYGETVGVVDYVYAYDAAGNLTAATGPEGTTAFGYDPNTNDLLRVDYPGGQYFVFQYDPMSRRTRREDQDGNVVNYAYGQLGLLDRMTDGSNTLIVAYDYSASGLLTKKTLGNGVYTTYDYDNAGHLLQLVNYRADETILSRFDYTYDATGRRIAMVTLQGTWTYAYDLTGQLVRAVFESNDPATIPDQDLVYEYDAVGNRIRTIVNGATEIYATNNMNQYQQVSSTVYEYDLDGNLISKTVGGETTTYRYDIENRLVEVLTATDTWTYQYDSLGNRIGATHNGVSTNYLVDPTGLGNVAAEYDGSGNLIARYDHGYGLLARTENLGDAAYYTFSAIGNTSELTGTAGAVLNSYAYDPFGSSLGKTEAVGNPFEFVGEFGVMSEGNGLEFMRARYYDSLTGRFLETDPIGIRGGLNPYTYTDNCPVSLIDPSGLKGGVLEICGIGIKVIEIQRESYQMLEQLQERRCRIYEELGADWYPNLPGPPCGRKCASDPRDPPSGQPILPPSGGPGGRGSSHTVVSFDPNDKLGPAGFGPAGHLQADGVLAYQVRFENMADATAPAREIAVTDSLDPSLDLSTFELLEIAFADQTIRVPAGLGSYETSVLMDANGTEILVEVTATLDRESRELTLMLMALDAATGWYPEDPLVGLLYPNDETGRGEGYISFLVRPLADLPSGTEITNRARIVFDYNDPIDTPLVRNTLDAGPPASWVQQLAAVVNPPEFLVTWDGADDAGGSGIACYDIFVSTDGGPFTRWLEDVTDTSALFSGEPGRTYAFYSVATDNVGHRELAPSDPEATTYVNIPPAIGVLSGDPGPIVVGSELTLTVTAVNDLDGEIQSVTFYRDTNGDGVWDQDDQVLEGTLQRSGDQWILSGVSTVGWDLNIHTVFARAQDNHGGWSEAAATAVMVAQLGGARVEMRMVTEPSETDAKGQVVPLPESIDWVHAWQSFWVEIWVSMDETATLGVAGAVVDLQYDTDFLTAQQIEYGAAFTEDRTGMIDDAGGQVTAIGGWTALTDAGRSGYVLLARVRFTSTGDDQVPVDEVERKIGPYGTQIELAGGYARLVDPGLVIPALGDSPSTELWALMYDIDGNHVIDFGELSFFAAAFGRTVDASAEPPFVWWADFDKSGRVDFGDLAFFAPNFNKSRTAVQSGAQTLVFPLSFPDAWGTGSGEPTGEGEAAGGPEEWEPTARVAGVPLGFDGSQASQAAWWNAFLGIEVHHAFVHEEHQALVPDPTGWLTDSGRELPVTRPPRDTSLPATSVEGQSLRFDGYEPLEDLLPLLADRPMDLTDLDAYFAALR